MRLLLLGLSALVGSMVHADVEHHAQQALQSLRLLALIGKA